MGPHEADDVEAYLGLLDEGNLWGVVHFLAELDSLSARYLGCSTGERCVDVVRGLLALLVHLVPDEADLPA